MSQEKDKFIAVSYQLYDEADAQHALIEATEEGRPFEFVSGYGITLPAFEAAVVNVPAGESFDFVIPAEQAYGAYHDAHVLDLDKAIFTIDGKFDDEHIVVGATIPLQNEDGKRFNGLVLAISDDKVKIDLNHPLAGKALHFKGTVLESRQATAEELSKYLNMLHGDSSCGCGGGGCGNCGGGCGGCH